MSIVRFGGFRGEIPRIHPRLLPEGGSQTALNCRMDSGALEAVNSTSALQATTLSDIISLFKYPYTANVWLESTTDVDWTPYPVTNDSFGRVIFTDAAADELRVTDASIVGTGGYPAVYRSLGIPAPVQGFQATLNGTADDATEVPETRFYVCTFVNEYGAEGPPSPASNQVEWRSGQTVTLSSLPAVPAGNYNITHRRIYRINTGASGVTNYQYVSEVAVNQNLLTLAAASQTSPPVIRTTTNHGLSDGQEVIFAGLGLADTNKPISAISKASPAQLTVTNHGLVTNNVVQLDGLGGGNGMDSLDGNRYSIVYVNVDKFELVGTDTTAETTYVGGGTVTQVYGMDELDDNQYVVAIKDEDEFTLESVDATGYKAYVGSGFVYQLSGTTYTDTIASASLGEIIPTTTYDPPNAATKGIKLHPAGFLVGFFGNTLAFSEPGAPHAWPIDYRLVTSHDIVGLGIFGNTVLVTTKGWPYLAIGSDPSAMTLVELEIEQACVAKRGIVDFGSAVCYPSPDGLILASNQGVENITAGIFTREQWQALVPSSLVSFNWEQQYLGFYDDGTTQRGFAIDPFDAGAGVRYFDTYTQAGHKEIEEDQIYIVESDTITRWDYDTSNKRTYQWKSKSVYTPRPVNMAGAKVIADTYPVTIDFWVDDVKRHTRIVQNVNAFRLPGGFRGEKFEIVAKGTRRISEVAMATTMNELAAVV